MWNHMASVCVRGVYVGDLRYAFTSPEDWKDDYTYGVEKTPRVPRVDANRKACAPVI